MCKRTTCNTCRKPSWAGCGAHVDQVLGDVAVADRCGCGLTDSPKSNWFTRLLGG